MFEDHQASFYTWIRSQDSLLKTRTLYLIVCLAVTGLPCSVLTLSLVMDTLQALDVNGGDADQGTEIGESLHFQPRFVTGFVDIVGAQADNNC